MKKLAKTSKKMPAISKSMSPQDKFKAMMAAKSGGKKVKGKVAKKK